MNAVLSHCPDIEKKWCGNSIGSLKNHKHVKKVGHTSEFSFLAFIDELEKQIIIKKTVEWANKRDKIILNIYNVLFKKIIKKNTCRYHYQNLDDIMYMIYSSSDMSKTYWNW